MSAKLRDPKILAATVLGAVAVIAAAAFFLVVSPEKSKIGTLDGQISGVQQRLDERKAALANPKADVHLRASDGFRLTRAMPDSIDMSGVILVLNRLSAGHHVTFNSIQPGAQVTQSGFNVQPLTVVVQGRFGDVSSFLGDLRKLVRVKRHELAASGRLFAVDAIDFAKPDNKADFPQVKATLSVDAFIFTGATLTPDPSTSTPSDSSGTVAAGANH
jgi:Tfp pilus assembly protein PilO